MTENATSVDEAATEVRRAVIRDIVRDDLAVGRTETVMIISKVRLGVTPDINALATIVILIVTIGVVIAGYLMRRAEKQRQRDAQMAAMEIY